MRKHTPGPWIVCEKVGLQVPVASVAMKGLALNVAHVAGIRDGEGEANARLIAAAPDLLEALKGVLAWGTDENWEHAKAWCEKARAAIAKATGEQT